MLKGCVHVRVPAWRVALAVDPVDSEAWRVGPSMKKFDKPTDVHVKGRGRRLLRTGWRFGGSLELDAARSLHYRDSVLRFGPDTAAGHQLIGRLEPPEELRDGRFNFAGQRALHGASNREFLYTPRGTLFFARFLAVEVATLFRAKLEGHRARRGPIAQSLELLLFQPDGGETVDLRGCGDVRHALGEQVLVLVLVMGVTREARRLRASQNELHVFQSTLQL
mmetsp:Transcript_103776/g.292711  ORF Transcript_103776/g.292711 Transcript_103776/m.292711 type:complete len:222 (+) Transcript_103776:2241-2906(+)